MSTQLSIANISLGTAQVTKQGFSTILFAARHNLFKERVRSYSKLDSLIADGFNEDTTVYKAMQGFFAQIPRPPIVKVGRVRSETVITVKNFVEGTIVGLTMTSSGNPTPVVFEHTITAIDTNATIATALAVLINSPSSGVDDEATATGNGANLSIISNSESVWITVSNLVGMTYTGEQPAMETASAAFSAMNDEDDDWYGITTDNKDPDWVEDVSSYMETQFRIYSVYLKSHADVLISDPTTGAYGETFASGRFRTLIGYHDQAETKFPELADLAEVLVYKTGSVTFHARTVAGIREAYGANGVKLTDTEMGYIKANNINTHTKVRIVGGTQDNNPSITYGGLVISGEPAHNIIARDNLQLDLEAALTDKQLAQKNSRITWSDEDLNSVVTVAYTVLKEYAKTGINEHNFIYPDFIINVPKSSDISVADKATHHLNHITFEAKLRGSIFMITIFGGLSL